MPPRYSSPSRHCHLLLHTALSAGLNLALLARMDLARRTAESARLYGIDFFSVLTRGSQYRVEAALVRQAKGRG